MWTDLSDSSYPMLFAVFSALKGTVVNGQLLLFPFKKKMFARTRALRNHKVLLFAKVPSSNQADFPLPLH